MKTREVDAVWDVVVIGGGPAGMMAAGRAAELGAKVVLLEKNDSLGKKLLITGGGRCNVTNAEFDTRALLTKYKAAGKFLASPFAQWGAMETIRFFETRGMPIKVEAEKRAFPASNSARSVWTTLVEYLAKGGVTVVPNARVASLRVKGDLVEAARLSKGNDIRGRSFILATGGISRPDTGSTGDGFSWLTALGHQVDQSGGALVPIALKESWVRSLAGVSLTNVKVSLYQDGIKQSDHAGKILFTHAGLSGPTILNMSREIGELLRHGEATLSLDLLPGEGNEKIDARLQELFTAASNKMIKNSLRSLIPTALTSVVLSLAEIPPETFCNSVTRASRIRLIKTLKHISLQVSHLLGLDKAVVTSGGLSLDDIDFKTMRSRRYPNLYVVGDLLDVDRPSGGYSLQLCWATAFVAGGAAVENRTDA